MQLEVSSRFETFRARGNLAAVEELCALKRQAGQPPLWLCGAPGTGKTHLLQAACVRLSERGRAAAYVPLEQCASFGPGLLAGYQELEAVFLDDLGAVAGDDAWEAALFTLHNELQEHGGRLVVAANPPPAGVSWGLPDLASRLAASSVFILKPLPEADQPEPDGRFQALFSGQHRVEDFVHDLPIIMAMQ